MTGKGADGAPQLLSTEEVQRFWERRHVAESDLRSGGDIGLTETDNVIFYQIRLGLLLQALAGSAPPPRGATVLDAGCGKGWFSRALARVGFCVHGVDASPSAIAFARESGGGPAYDVTALAAFQPTRHFDAVISVDVMFHITDDQEWSASLRNLAGIVALGGVLVLADTMAPRRRNLGDYIVHRPRDEYLDQISRVGYIHREGLPYRFRSNPLGLHVYQRAW